jgi:hypothetical protein
MPVSAPVLPRSRLLERLRKEFTRYPSLEIRAKVTASHLLATLLIRPEAKTVRRMMKLAEIIYRILPIPGSRMLIGGQKWPYTRPSSGYAALTRPTHLR